MTTRDEEAGELCFYNYLLGWNYRRGQSTPTHHLDIADWLDRMWRGQRRRLLLMAFRGAGKSTVLGLFCAWLLTIRPDLRILALSADEALARRMLRSARKAIERHPESARLLPARPDQWSAERFTVAGSPHGRDASMLAAGLDGNVTGARADVVVCDDVEVPKTCATPALRDKLRERLGELEFVLTPDGMQLYAGTPHAWDSIYGPGRPEGAGGGKAESGPGGGGGAGGGPGGGGGAEGGGFLAGYERFELPVMDESGAPAWPERYGGRHIRRLRKRSGPARFASQMMLRPADPEETRLDIRLIRPYEADLDLRTANGEQTLFLDGRRMFRASCWWDPAYGGERRRAASAVACVFTDDDGGYFIHDVEYLRNDPGPDGLDAATAQCRRVRAFAERNLLPAVTVETNGVGAFLPGLLQGVLAGSGIAVAQRHTHGQKAARILKAFDARLAAGALHAHRDVLSGPFGDEMRSWRPAGGGGSGRGGGGRGGGGGRAVGGARDDALDAVAGCLEVSPAQVRKTAPLPRPPRRWPAASGVHRVTMA